MRSLRCSAAPSSWTTWSPNLSAGPPAASPLIEIAAALLAWLGAALVVLADARRGLSLGLALVTIGCAVLAWGAGQPVGAIALTAGGLTGAFRCWTAGQPDAWGLMPPGSTPRLVLCVAAGLLALWIAASVTTAAGSPPLLFAILVVLGLMAARVLAGGDAIVSRTAIACFALALASSPALASRPGSVPYVFGALIAAAVIVVPATLPRAVVRPGKDGG